MYSEKELLEKLTMAQLREEINNTDKNHSKLKKEDLITMLQTEISGNEMRLQNLTRKYPHIFSLFISYPFSSRFRFPPVS
ncbi:TPA: hypothetical protein ROX88_002268 [Bacillus pseudomycoides]|nr:hypothetical protein [Bacillus pseudomycoides]